MNIIIVEDHDSLREVTVSALGELGYNAKGINSGENLDYELVEFSPHIIVLDLNLPGEDGVSISKRIRANYPEIGIIMLTARTESKDKIVGYASGADIYLSKPTSIEELAATIQALSRRITVWADASLQLRLDPKSLQVAERARAIHQQLTNTKGKLPTLEELASQYSCPARKLNEEFIAEYGQSIHAYINEHRLNQAHRAVLETDIAIKQIADRLGYAHVNNFYSAFQTKFGYSPGYLRKTAKGN